jgi:hypothetical protein
MGEGEANAGELLDMCGAELLDIGGAAVAVAPSDLPHFQQAACVAKLFALQLAQTTRSDVLIKFSLFLFEIYSCLKFCSPGAN